MARTRAQTTQNPAPLAADALSSAAAPPSAANDAAPESPFPPATQADAQAGAQADPARSADEPAQQQQQAGTAEEPDSDRDERIRQAAYRRFEARGNSHGDPVQDWLDAEAEVDSTGPGR